MVHHLTTNTAHLALKRVSWTHSFNGLKEKKLINRATRITTNGDHTITKHQQSNILMIIIQTTYTSNNTKMTRPMIKII